MHFTSITNSPVKHLKVITFLKTERKGSGMKLELIINSRFNIFTKDILVSFQILREYHLAQMLTNYFADSVLSHHVCLRMQIMLCLPSIKIMITLVLFFQRMLIQFP